MIRIKLCKLLPGDCHTVWVLITLYDILVIKYPQFCLRLLMTKISDSYCDITVTCNASA